MYCCMILRNIYQFGMNKSQWGRKSSGQMQVVSSSTVDDRLAVDGRLFAFPRVKEEMAVFAPLIQLGAAG